MPAPNSRTKYEIWVNIPSHRQRLEGYDLSAMAEQWNRMEWTIERRNADFETETLGPYPVNDYLQLTPKMVERTLQQIEERGDDRGHIRWHDGALVIEYKAEGKPGPPKSFPYVINLRVGEQTRSKLRRLAQKSGETESDVIRRLIYEVEE